MAEPGDDAVAAGMDVIVTSAAGGVKDGGNQINKTRDYIAQFFNRVRTIALGGTGATTAADARTNLDVYSKEDVDGKHWDAGAITSGTLGVGVSAPGADIACHSISVGASLGIGGTGKGFDPTGNLYAVSAAVDGAVNAGGVSTGGLNASGAVNFTGLSGSSSGTAVQIVGSQLYKYTSSARFKTDITTLSVDELLPVLDAQIVSYRDKVDPADAGLHVGVIAEQLVEAGLGAFVSLDENGQPEAVNYGQLAAALIPIVALLRGDVAALKQQLEAKAS